MAECTDNCSTSRYVINDDLNGPAFAIIVGIEMILALLTNLTIFIFTLYQWKSLKQPSIIFLTGLVLANLIVAIFFMPFTVITAAVGEWIFGKTVREKEAVCEFVGFMLGLSFTYSTHTLALISFDRFLFIVKPLLYIKYMKTWTAVVIISTLWVILTVLNTTPWYGLSKFEFAPHICSCFPKFTRNYVIYFSLISIIPYTTIIITSTWTFIHTKRFITRRHNENMVASLSIERQELRQTIYNRKICNLIGIFGTLLIVHLVSLAPYIIVSIVGLIVGFRNIPTIVLASTLVLYLLHSFTTAVVQSYFRQDLRHMFIKVVKRMCCRRHSNNLQVNQESNVSSNAQTKLTVIK